MKSSLELQLNTTSRNNIEAMGNEKIVTIDPQHPDQVQITLRTKESGYHPTPLQIQGRFHLTNLLNLLFPNTIPQMLSINKNDGSFNLKRFDVDAQHQTVKNVRTRTETGQEVSTIERIKAHQLVLERENDPEVKKFIATLKNLKVVVDPTGDNYSYSPLGDLQYLDNSFRPWQINRVGKQLIKAYDDEKLSQAIESLTPEARNEAQKHLIKLQQLFNEEVANLQTHPEKYDIKM